MDSDNCSGLHPRGCSSSYQLPLHGKQHGIDRPLRGFSETRGKFNIATVEELRGTRSCSEQAPGPTLSSSRRLFVYHFQHQPTTPIVYPHLRSILHPCWKQNPTPKSQPISGLASRTAARQSIERSSYPDTFRKSWWWGDLPGPQLLYWLQRYSTSWKWLDTVSPSKPVSLVPLHQTLGRIWLSPRFTINTNDPLQARTVTSCRVDRVVTNKRGRKLAFRIGRLVSASQPTAAACVISGILVRAIPLGNTTFLAVNRHHGEHLTSLGFPAY